MGACLQCRGQTSRLGHEPNRPLEFEEFIERILYFRSALVAQWFTRLSLNQEVPGSRPEADTGGALVVWPGDVVPEQTRL